MYALFDEPHQVPDTRAGANGFDADLKHATDIL